MYRSTRWRVRSFAARAVVAFAVAVAAVAGLAISAAPALASCGTAPDTWPTQPRLLLHLGELKPTGWANSWNGLTTQMELLAQVDDAVDQFNSIGGTSARVTSVGTTSDPFTYKGSYNDSSPTIHVGFASNAKITADNNGNSAAGLTTIPIYLSKNCSPTRTIEFPNLDSKSWSFSSPFALARTARTTTTPGPPPRTRTAAASGSGRRSCTS